MSYLPKSVTGWQPPELATLTAGETPALDSRARFMGCNWAAFAQDLHGLGGFSEHFGPGSVTGSIGQESEMQRRLLSSGAFAVYVASALVYHWVPRDRCSPEFALHRAYREGVKRGQLIERVPGLSVGGYSVHHVKRTLQAWLRWRRFEISTDRTTSFGEQLADQEQRGRLDGLALRMRRAPHRRGRQVLRIALQVSGAFEV